MRQIVIVGNCAAGISAVTALREKNKSDKVIVVSDEDYPAYYRCLISYFLAGDIKEEALIFKSKEFYQENNIELMLGRAVTRVDPKKNRIILEYLTQPEIETQKEKTKTKTIKSQPQPVITKSELEYDALILANGASSKVPKELKGVRKTGVFGLRTIKDVKDMQVLSMTAKTACILGGGLIGLKAAYALKKRGLDVKVIVKSPYLLSQVADETAGRLIQDHLEENGIEVLTQRDVSEILGNGDVKAVKLDNAKVLSCELIVVGKGVSPNIDIVAETEIRTNYGIITDDFMQTSVPNIYACGDIAETYDLTLGKSEVNALWPNAVAQGKVAAANLLGEGLKYKGSMGMNSVDFFGLPLIAMGITNPKDESFEVHSRLDEKNAVYRKVVLKDNHLVGLINVGKIENSGVFMKLIESKIDIAPVKDKLLEEDFDYAKINDLIQEENKVYV